MPSKINNVWLMCMCHCLLASSASKWISSIFTEYARKIGDCPNFPGTMQAAGSAKMGLSPYAHKSGRSTIRLQNAAFTLLELILALALTAMVLVALGMAVDLHLRLLDSGRTKVEEAQLAREIMRSIARDLRTAVPYNTNSKSNSSSSSGSSGSTGQSGQQSNDTTTTNTLSTTTSAGQSTSTTTEDTTTTDSEDRTSDLADAGPQSTPGLYGNAYQLQVDVSRLPRVDQYAAVANLPVDMTNADQICDMKNVSYFVVNSGAAPALGTIGGATTLYGLFRREVGRASGAYAAQQGQSLTTTDDLLPFAPEVEAIAFQYSDGSQWYDTWDSVSNGNLPVAVEITISITPQHPRSTANLQPDMYHLLVSIPAAKPAASQTTSSTSSTSSTTGTTQ